MKKNGHWTDSASASTLPPAQPAAQCVARVTRVALHLRAADPCVPSACYTYKQAVVVTLLLALQQLPVCYWHVPNMPSSWHEGWKITPQLTYPTSCNGLTQCAAARTASLARATLTSAQMALVWKAAQPPQQHPTTPIAAAPCSLA
jgi:hypothetical protein